jgi:bacterioferritin (cytochrome b1)
MDRSEPIAFLNHALHMTVNSVVQYLAVASPYVPPGCEKHLETLARMREDETRDAQVLTELVQRLDGVPAVGAFPYWNIDLNYLDLRFLAGFAAEHQKKAIADMEAGLERLRGEPRAYRAVREILERKRADLAKLLEIARRPEKPAPKPPPPARPAGHGAPPAKP